MRRKCDTYVLLQDVLKFGFSSREYVLLHDQSKEDEEDSSEVDASGEETEDLFDVVEDTTDEESAPTSTRKRLKKKGQPKEDQESTSPRGVGVGLDNDEVKLPATESMSWLWMRR